MQFAQRLPQVTALGGAAVEPGERVRRAGERGLDVLAARICERGDLATLLARDGDETLVLELAQRGVDRAGAGLPGTGRALLDRRDDLVAVHRRRLEELEDRDPHVAALDAPSAATAAPSTPRAAGPEALGAERPPGASRTTGTTGTESARTEAAAARTAGEPAVPEAGSQRCSS
ncbi:hypothetical protein MTP03_25760 [Tsukamurella sp. PLM1]|nr:hypothetical protein MTP03_25760 [Tsukamurella sp. PLM1]